MKIRYLTTACLMGSLMSIFLLVSCSGGGGKADEDTTAIKEEEKVTLQACPTFDENSAYNFVKAQVDFGPRVPNTASHRKCGDYLISQLKNFGWDTLAQNFDAIAYNGTVLKSRNIIGVFNPKATTRILLAAHWDTRPFNDKEVEDSTQFKPIDGANDGASGVGILLEIARVVGQAKNKPSVGIDIIFFDSEDYGHPENFKGDWKPDLWCLGSQHWAKNPHQANYTAYYGILLDMVGARGATFYREGQSMKFAPKIVNQVWQIANQLGYINFFKFQNSPEITDDHVYVNQLAKIPMIDIIEYAPTNPSYFGDYHHTSKDNMELIDAKTLKAVGQTVLQTLYNESAQ